MKTTIYELLGMIKDNKAPKKIKYNKSIYEYYWPDKDYVSGTHWLFDECVTTEILNDEVEILDGAKPDKIEKLYFHDLDDISDNEKILIVKINEIIDYINKEV